MHTYAAQKSTSESQAH